LRSCDHKSSPQGAGELGMDVGLGRCPIVRKVLRIAEPIPLIGHIAFGVIDRGTNLLQLRPTTSCPLSCIFCSVDAGPHSRHRATEYIVDPNYLVEWFRWAVKAKSLDKAHAYIDAVGDPLAYPRIVELVRALKSLPFVETVAMETHGAMLTEKLAEALDDAGLDRLNLSLDALNPELARTLAGAPWFDVRRVMRVAEYIASSLRMDLLIAPVWVPGLNDSEIPKIVEYALRIGAGKRWPPLGIQKYEAHKYGRRPRGVRPLRWREFYEALRKWEREYGVKLVLRPEDFGIKRAKSIPLAFRRFERVSVRVVGPGWLRGQWLGVARNRVITVVGAEGDPPLMRRVPVRILRVKHNIYVAELA